ncbi:hypothetical protein [Pantoea piersonii]|uniref:hypothetical protein n=1 Tax=Pantoea piersonii TaxID=2364647 RepID=UPI0028AE0E53|nr:hypothetical protein [Pantoea piersonii]
MAISFADIDQQAASLKKARAVLSVLLESPSSCDDREDFYWLISLAHDTVNDTIEALESVTNQEIKSRDKREK